MKFFHVYNEDCFKGLEKNGLINKNSGFKIQNVFSVPNERLFNNYAAKGTPLHDLIKNGKHPFYVDRIAGGITYFDYKYDKALIHEYAELLGDWFLGFQLHESGSNIRHSDRTRLYDLFGNGPYTASEIREKLPSKFAITPYGERLVDLSHGTPEEYEKLPVPTNYKEFIEDMVAIYKLRLEDTDGHILPCDSYFLATRLFDTLGVKTFMPEVGSQIQMMRASVASARGAAKASKKTWGTYYECWRYTPGVGCTMPCFNPGKSNEWYLSQDTHPDDFTSFGANGGSSRLLQNRIYYHSLMSGADYMSEEWGLNCSYTDMEEFTLSPYGQTKKDFINESLKFENVKAHIPFAIVLPTDYECIRIQDPIQPFPVGKHRDTYLDYPITQAEQDYFGHIEDVIKLFFCQKELKYGNEGHVIANSYLPDVADIIYADASDAVFNQYEYLIDATPDGRFAKAKKDSCLKIITTENLDKFVSEMQSAIKAIMPCYVDDLCWLVSTDDSGRRFLSIFNNDGNERTHEHGDVVDPNATKTVTISFKDSSSLKIFKEGYAQIQLERIDDTTYRATIPGADFVIMEF